MPATALVGATIIDGSGRPPVQDGVVFIDGERIVNVFRRGEAGLADCEVVDLSGCFVLPGLIDGHAHVGAVVAGTDFTVQDPEVFSDTFMRAFTRWGITTVRDTGSPDVLLSFQTLKQGRPGWPRFYGSGPNLDGKPGAPWSGLLPLATVHDARREAARLIDAGVDFLKTYVWMDETMLAAVVDEAHKRGVRVASHAGHVLTVRRAVELGVDALEHVRIGRELVSAEHLEVLDSLPARDWDWLFSFRPWRYIDVDSKPCRDLIALLVERGVYLTPTLVVARAVLQANVEAVVCPEGTDDLPSSVAEQWRAEAFTSDYSEFDWEMARLEWERQLEFIGAAHEAGVKIVAGTDTPNPFVVPGLSLHTELGLLAEAGLAPLEVITSATIRAAELLGVAGEIGTVEKGKQADLLVVDRDPLQDLRYLRRVVQLYRSGRPVLDTGTIPPAVRPST